MKLWFACFVFISFLAVLLAACGSTGLRAGSGATEQKTAALSFTPTATTSPSATNTPSPTLTMPPTPTPTETPTLTPTPTQALPVSEGTPFPRPAAVIQPENAAQIQELARYGKPVTFSIQITSDRKRIIVSDSQGIWIYDREKQEPIGYIDATPKGPDGSIFPNQDGSRLAVLTLQDIRIVDDQNQLVQVFAYPAIADFANISITLSPDLSLAAFYAYEYNKNGFAPTVQVWDIQRNEMVFESKESNPMFLGDGKHLVMGTSVYEIESWRKHAISWLWYRSYYGNVSSPDGKLLGLVADGKIAIWNTEDAKFVSIITEMNNINLSDIAFSTNNQYLVVKRDWNTLEVWNTANGLRINNLDREGGWPMGWLIIGDDGQVSIDAFAEALSRPRGGWQIDMLFDTSGSALHSIDRQTFIDGENWWAMQYTACAYRFWESPDCAEAEHLLFYDNQGQLYSMVRQENKTHELHQGGEAQESILATLRGGDRIVAPGPMFSPDRRFLIFTTYDDAPGSEATNVWRMIDDQRVKRWQGSARTLAVSPDGRYLAMIIGKQSGYRVFGNYLLVYDMEINKAVYHEDGNQYLENIMAFSADGTALVYANTIHNDSLHDIKTVQVRRLDLVTGKTVDAFTIDLPRSSNSYKALTSMAFSPDGKIMAIGNRGGSILFLNPVDGSVQYEWHAHRDGVARLAFSADGRLLASSSQDYNSGYDGFIRVWGISP